MSAIYSKHKDLDDSLTTVMTAGMINVVKDKSLSTNPETMVYIKGR